MLRAASTGEGTATPLAQHHECIDAPTLPPAVKTEIGELYDRNIADLWPLAYTVCADGPCAERAIERTFVEIAPRWAQSAQHRSPRATLFSLVHHQARAELRASGQPPSPMARLTESRGEIIALASFGGLTVTQIAEQLDVPSKAIRQLMRTALKALADMSFSAAPSSPDRVGKSGLIVAGQRTVAGYAPMTAVSGSRPSTWRRGVQSDALAGTGDPHGDLSGSHA